MCTTAYAGEAPAEARTRAFGAPLHFTSRGQVTALVVKLDRDFAYTFEPVRRESAVRAVSVTVVDHVHDDRESRGVVETSEAGTLPTTNVGLVNACSVTGLDPVTLERLKQSDGPVRKTGTGEISGSLVEIEVTHHRSGEVADDGSMRVESSIESQDGRVKLTTITIVAPDGLPWIADTAGTVKKGPISLPVKIQLRRILDGQHE